MSASRAVGTTERRVPAPYPVHNFPTSKRPQCPLVTGSQHGQEVGGGNWLYAAESPLFAQERDPLWAWGRRKERGEVMNNFMTPH